MGKKCQFRVQVGEMSASLNSQHSTFGEAELSRQVERMREQVSELQKELATRIATLVYRVTHMLTELKLCLWIVILMQLRLT